MKKLYATNDKNNIIELTESNYQTETQLQTLIESNLNSIFKIKFVKSEVVIESFRFDTIAYDEKLNSFVIIEYKKNKSNGVTTQILAYKSTMLRNKALLVLLYNEEYDAKKSIKDFNWSNTRTIIITHEYNDYQLEYLESIPNIKAYKYNHYENGMLLLEELFTPTNVNKQLNLKTNNKIEKSKATNLKTNNLYDSLVFKVKKIDKTLKIEKLSKYIGIKQQTKLNEQNLVGIQIQNHGKKLLLTMSIHQSNLPVALKDKVRNIEKINTSVSGNIDFRIWNQNDLTWAIEIIKIGYQQLKK